MTSGSPRRGSPFKGSLRLRPPCCSSLSSARFGSRNLRRLPRAGTGDAARNARADRSRRGASAAVRLARGAARQAHDVPHLRAAGRAIRLAARTSPASARTRSSRRPNSGVWEITVGPIDAGAYRYNFNVDGVATIDPRNPAISESNNNVWSLVYVPGSDVFDTKNVPHGAVAEVTYNSTALGKFRRMHVYTPPGYEAGTRPLSGLLPAARRRRQRRRVVVGGPGRLHPRQPDRREEGAPDGRRHARRPHVARSRQRDRPGGDRRVRQRLRDRRHAVRREALSRAHRSREHRHRRALDGRRSHAATSPIPRLERFAYIGVYSSGLLGAFPDCPTAGRPRRRAARRSRPHRRRR